MRLYVISLLLIGSNAQIEDDTGSDWLKRKGFEEVTKPPLGATSALHPCGQGPDAGKKVCVEYSRCDGTTNTITPEGVINTSGAGLIDVRENVNVCPKNLEVCCNVPDENSPITSTTTTTTTTTTTPRSSTVDSTSSRTLIRKRQGCGIRNEQGLDFQITGHTNEAEYAEFPWMAALLRTNPQPNETEYFCGGSLIAPSVVLTGAHCVDKYRNNLDQIKIRLGEWDTLSQNERITHQERSIKQIIVHEQFNPRALLNNVALLITERPFSKADHIGTICLPPTGSLADSKDCFATGWGKDKFSNKAQYAAILKKLKMPMVSRDKCEASLRKTRLSKHFVLNPSFVCAGGESVDTCSGDGGSPLVCPDPNNPSRYLQVGIVSWGIGCREFGTPGVYANVAFLRSWIDQQMKTLSFNTAPYQ